MDIRLTPWVSQNAAALARPGPAVQPQAWMRELEHARWQAQPRLQPESPLRSGMQQGADATPNTGQLPAQTQGTVGDLEQQASRSAQADTRGDGGLARTGAARSFSAGAVSLSGPQSLTLPLFAQAFVADELHRRRRDSNLRCVPERLQPQAHEAWARRSVHVHLEAEELSVWIRDTSLDAQAALAVLDSLAAVHGAQSHAYRQVRLTVNGRPVVTAAQLPPHNSFYSGEHRGD